MIVLDRAPYLGGRGMAVPDEGFKLNVGGHLLEDSGSGITKIFEYLGKHLGHGPSNTDMNVWDHEASSWGSIRDRYSGGKDELKKVTPPSSRRPSRSSTSGTTGRSGTGSSSTRPTRA